MMMRVPPSAEGVSFGAPIPDPSSRWIYIVSPKPGSPVRLTMLAKEGVSVLTHWHSDLSLSGKGRTVPHTTPDDSCPYCIEANQMPRWHTYIPCWWPASSRFVLADVTVYAAQRCPELVPGSGKNLRGSGLLLQRIGKNGNSPIRAEIERGTMTAEQLPPTFDPVAALMRLWGCSSAKYWRVGRLLPVE
jgi:hypothetical protein